MKSDPDGGRGLWQETVWSVWEVRSERESSEGCVQDLDHSELVELLQEGGGPLPGPKSVLLSNTQNELSKETQVLTKQKTLLGRGSPVESSRVRQARRTALSRGLQSQVLR